MTITHNIYIAVVDDDDSLSRSMGRLLRAAHLQPISYPSAEAFLSDAKHPKFDCLLLDIQLGGMSGLELGQSLVAAKDTTPIVYLTAHDAPEVRAQAAATGCVAYLRKTDSGADVLAAIRRAVGLCDPAAPEGPGGGTSPGPAAGGERRSGGP
jgi:FixJ family two-component response regulator